MQTSIFSITDHEVFVITAGAARERCGFTATWVMPATLLPGTPRFVIMASPLNHSLTVMRKTKRFVLHMLSENQARVMATFGLGSSATTDKFAGLAWHDHTHGPVLEGTCGYQYCSLIHEVDLGERIVLLGETREGVLNEGVPPLTKQSAFAALDAETVSELKAKHAAMAELSKSLMISKF